MKHRTPHVCKIGRFAFIRMSLLLAIIKGERGGKEGRGKGRFTAQAVSQLNDKESDTVGLSKKKERKSKKKEKVSVVSERASITAWMSVIVSWIAARQLGAKSGSSWRSTGVHHETICRSSRSHVTSVRSRIWRVGGGRGGRGRNPVRRSRNESFIRHINAQSHRAKKKGGTIEERIMMTELRRKTLFFYNVHRFG